MLRLPLGISFDFLGTIARFRDGASVGAIYQDFTKFLSPIDDRSTPITEAMGSAIRSIPSATIDKTFRESFKDAAQLCFGSEHGLRIHVPHENKYVDIKVPGGTTHEETEEFWLYVVRNTYARAIDNNNNNNNTNNNNDNKHQQELIQCVLENDCFVEDFFYPLYEHLGSAAAYECPPYVIDTLDWLKSVRCCETGHELKLVMVSNFDARLHDIVRGLQLNRYFDSVLTLHETKSLKPNPYGLRRAIFEQSIFDSALHTNIFHKKFCANSNSISMKTDIDKEEVLEILLNGGGGGGGVKNNNNNNKNNDKMVVPVVSTPKFWVHVGDSKADAGAAAQIPCLFCPVNPSPESSSNSPLSSTFNTSDIQVREQELIDTTLMKDFMIHHFATEEYVSRLLNAGEVIKSLPERFTPCLESGGKNTGGVIEAGTKGGEEKSQKILSAEGKL